MRRDSRLHEDDGLLRINAGGDVQRGGLACLGAENSGIDGFGNRYGVQVDDAEDVVVEILVLDPERERTHIVTNMDFPGRLNTGKRSLSLHIHGCYRHTLYSIFVPWAGIDRGVVRAVCTARCRTAESATYPPYGS